MSRVFVCEKPDQAWNVAAALGGASRKDKPQGYYRTKEGPVTWCYGHLFRLKQPEEISERWERWTIDTLPIVPDRYDYVANESGQASFVKRLRQHRKVLGKLFREAREAVIATDDDREGERIAWQALELLGFKGSVTRMRYKTYDPIEIRRALRDARSAEETIGRYHASRARDIVDWLFGMGPSRAATLRFRAPGERGANSTGRVQGPTLAMVVDRDQAIASFVPRDYLEITATADPASGPLRLRHAPAAPRREEDEDLRIYDPETAAAIRAAAEGFRGPLAVKTKPKRRAPPALFYLRTLQGKAAGRFGWTADRTLAVAQRLYEKQFITYPRTDNPHLSAAMAKEAPPLLLSLMKLPLFGGLAHVFDTAGRPMIRDAVYSDRKLEGSSHHAIIPNVNYVTLHGGFDVGRLEREEAQLFELIARSYLAAHLPDYEFDQTRIWIDVPVVLQGRREQRRFAATGSVMRKAGWRAVYGRDDDDEEAAALPPVREGESVVLRDAEVETKQTRPPEAFGEASLLAAMEKAGLGTEATRADVLKTLRARDYIAGGAKAIHATRRGVTQVLSLRPVAPALCAPETTAGLESALTEVEAGKCSAEDVIGRAEQTAREITLAIARADARPAAATVPASGGRRGPRGVPVRQVRRRSGFSGKRRRKK